MIIRTQASDSHALFDSNPLNYDTTVYSGLLNLSEDGTLFIVANDTYPLRAGEYQVIAGKFEML